MHALVEKINNSKLLIGLAIIIANVGGRYISLELSKAEERFLQSPWVRRAMVFVVTFMACRDFTTSVIVTVLFVLVMMRGELYGMIVGKPQEAAAAFDSSISGQTNMLFM
jgi:hypothetical protein